MTYDEHILSYEMNKKDKSLAVMADRILHAYDISCNRFTSIYESENTDIQYKTLHTPEGYSFVMCKHGKPSWIYTTNDTLASYIKHVFFVRSGIIHLNWDDVRRTNAVIDALQEEYGSEHFFIQYIPDNHERFGDCLVCGALKRWSTGYYRFNDDGVLEKVSAA